MNDRIPAVLEWEYETKQSGSIAGKPIYKTTHKFTDVTTKVKWEPLNASEKASDLEVNKEIYLLNFILLPPSLFIYL